MTFEEYAKKHLIPASYGAGINLVRLGWNARGRYGNHIAEPSKMVIEPTPAMIEAGAQRLVAWEDDSVWPDSWDALTVAAARNDAERVLRAALNVESNGGSTDERS